MGSLNRVFLVGRLGKDPEARDVNGSMVCNFSVATSEKYKKDGELVEVTEWHNIVTWNKTADNCNLYLKKGSQVLVEGGLKTRSWEDKEGVKKYATDVIARNVTFLDSKPAGTKTETPAHGEVEIPFS